MSLSPLRLVFLAVVLSFCASASALPPETNDKGGTLYGVDPAGSGKPSSTLPRLTQPAVPGSEKTGLSVLFYPMVLVGLAAGAFYVMRSGLPARMLQKNAERKLQVSEIRSLGNRQFLVVAEYETTRLLLGVSQGRIDLLCHLNRDAAEGEDFAPLVQAELSKDKKP